MEEIRDFLKEEWEYQLFIDAETGRIRAGTRYDIPEHEFEEQLFGLCTQGRNRDGSPHFYEWSLEEVYNEVFWQVEEWVRRSRRENDPEWVEALADLYKGPEL